MSRGIRVMMLGTAALAGVGALAFVGSRLADAFEQLHAVAIVDAPAAHSGSAAEPTVITAVATPAASEATSPAVDAAAPGTSGDEHILRMLAADPEFQRGADELLNDPDPRTQQAARQLLRELGVGAGVTVVVEP